MKKSKTPTLLRRVASSQYDRRTANVTEPLDLFEDDRFDVLKHELGYCLDAPDLLVGCARRAEMDDGSCAWPYQPYIYPYR